MAQAKTRRETRWEMERERKTLVKRHEGEWVQR